MAGAPAFEKAMEIRPGDREKFTPLGLDGGDFHGRLSPVYCRGKRIEVGVQQFFFPGFAAGFIETTADEVGDVLHPAAATDILEVECGNPGAISGEAEVGQLGIAVDESLEGGGVERFVNL